MGIQELLDKICEGEMYKRVATRQNMSLAQLIDALRNIESATRDGNPSKPVKLQDGRGVADISSYRGYYSDLAIEPSETPISARRPELNVLELLKILDSAIGKSFTGYKGGDFRMEAHTPMWVSEFGSASGMAVKGVELVDGYAVIKTEYVE